MIDIIKEFLSYDIYEGITVKFVCIILLSIVVGRILDSLTLWMLNRFITKSERKALDKKQEKKKVEVEEGEGRPRWSLLNSQFALTLSALRIDILKCLKKPLHVFWLTVGCSFGLYFVKIPEKFENVCGYIFTALHVISLWCIIWFILNVTNQIVMPRTKARAKKSSTPIDEILYPMLITLFKIVLICFGVLIVIEACGGDVSNILATLGIGGAALALASKDTLANFFGSLVILLDNPFVIGDWVTINGYEGNIHEIRLRTTTIKTFDDTIVTIPNSLLTNTQIDTRGKYKSKMDCSFGVLYSTKPEQIDRIVSELEEYINNLSKGEERKFEPKNYIYFSGFGESCMNITAVLYTHNTNYKEHVKLKHQVLLEIIRIVNRAGTGFAFPTRTLELPAKPIKVAFDDGLDDSAVAERAEDETLESVLTQVLTEGNRDEEAPGDDQESSVSLDESPVETLTESPESLVLTEGSLSSASEIIEAESMTEPDPVECSDEITEEITENKENKDSETVSDS